MSDSKEDIAREGERELSKAQNGEQEVQSDSIQERVEGQGTNAQHGRTKPHFFTTVFVACVVCHAVGASTFCLPYAMAHSGIVVFGFVMTFEAFSTGCVLIFIQEMSHGKNPDDYFSTMETNLPKIFMISKVVRITFVIDVVICTAFYFTCASLTPESALPDDYLFPKRRFEIRIVTQMLTAMFLVLVELKGKKTNEQVINEQSNCTIFNLEKSTVEQINVVAENNSTNGTFNQPEGEMKIDMTTVSGEMTNFNAKRIILLVLFFVLLLPILMAVCFYFNKNEEKSEMIENFLQNKVISMAKIFPEVTFAIPIIIWSLRNYTFILPVCPKESGLQKEQYMKTVAKSKLTLVAVLLLLTLPVYFTFGDAVMPFYPNGYGCNMIGITVAVLCYCLILNAMSLRTIPCCKMIQVLILNREPEHFFFIIIVAVLSISLLISAVVSNILHLVIFAGSVTSNLLLYIFPCVAYICWAWKKYKNGGRLGTKFALLCETNCFGTN